MIKNNTVGHIWILSARLSSYIVRRMLTRLAYCITAAEINQFFLENGKTLKLI